MFIPALSLTHFENRCDVIAHRQHMHQHLNRIYGTRMHVFLRIESDLHIVTLLIVKYAVISHLFSKWDKI